MSHARRRIDRRRARRARRLAARPPSTWRALASMALRARVIVEGAYAGMHHNPHAGTSIEFAEHKEYAAGRRPAAHGLEGRGARRALLHQALRGTRPRCAPSCSSTPRLDGLQARAASRSSSMRATSRPRSATCSASRAIRRASSSSTSDAAVPAAAHARRAHPRAAARARGRLRAGRTQPGARSRTTASWPIAAASSSS
jgi:hypothetical protein